MCVINEEQIENSYKYQRMPKSLWLFGLKIDDLSLSEYSNISQINETMLSVYIFIERRSTDFSKLKMTLL